MQAIGLLLAQIFLLWVKSCFEKDAEKRQLQNDLRVEGKEAIKSGDRSRIVGVLDRVRNS